MPLASRSVTRTTAAIAASTTVFAALLLAGCGGEDKAAAPAATTSASAAAAAVVDSSKAGIFVVNLKNAYPKLVAGRTDAQIAGILTETCTNIKSGKSQDDAVAAIIKLSKNGTVEATKDEALAVYQMAKFMCG